MSNYTLIVPSGATNLWSGHSFEFRHIGSNKYDVYSTNLNGWWWAILGHTSNPHTFEIEETSTNNWADAGSGTPHHLVATASTTQPTAPTSGSSTATLTSTNRYLHLFHLSGSTYEYMGYLDAYTTGSTYPSNIATAGGTWGAFNYVFVSETGTQFRYRKSGAASSTDIYFDTSDNKWYDGSSGGQPSAFWNKTVNPNGGGGNPSIACSVGDQIQLQDGPGQGNRGTFTHPTISQASSGPTSYWSTPPAPLSNGTNMARNIQVVFTPTTTAHYQIVETTNNNKVHWESNGTIGQLSANITQTIVFKVRTDVAANPQFRVRYANIPYTFVGTPYTPSSAPVPFITPQWGGLSTANNNAGGQIVVSFATGFGNQAKMFYHGTDGDEIQIRDSNNVVHATRRFGPNFDTATDTITINPVFQTHEVGTSKTFKVFLRNVTYGKATYHDFVLDPNNSIQSGSYASPYTAQYSISNPVWAPQNGNVISVSWTETNPPPSTGVELWKTNGTQAISSSLQGGPLTYTLQSASDNGTYELKYNGATISTSGTFTYQASSYMTWGTPSWSVTGYNGAATIECTFTYVNVGIGGGSAAQAMFRYMILNTNTWVWAPYPSSGNAITTPGSGTITLSWPNVQNGDVFQLDLAGQTFPASVHTVANLATAPGSGGGGTTTPYTGAVDNGGGPKRYPMILTQLFNKKRSFYSIGMTHKDGQLDCFL